jgi:hypothetical protein
MLSGCQDEAQIRNIFDLMSWTTDNYAYAGQEYHLEDSLKIAAKIIEDLGEGSQGTTPATRIRLPGRNNTSKIWISSSGENIPANIKPAGPTAEKMYISCILKEKRDKMALTL